jgi:hypothetical protein
MLESADRRSAGLGRIVLADAKLLESAGGTSSSARGRSLGFAAILRYRRHSNLSSGSPPIPARPYRQPEAELHIVYAVQTISSHGAFDRLFRAVAEQNTASLIWMSESGSVFAPYDSGVDLFLRKFSTCEALKARHADWLSIQSVRPVAPTQACRRTAGGSLSRSPRHPVRAALGKPVVGNFQFTASP